MKAIVAIVVLVFVAAIGLGIYTVAQPDVTETCTISDKTATNKSGDQTGTDYRIYTEDCGTFQVADSLTRGTFSSSDTYGKIKVGHTYELTHHGFRNGFLSMFPNITEAVEVK